MPYFVFKEIRTPLILFRIRLFREMESRKLYIKFGNKRRKRLFRKAKSIK